MAWQAWRPKTQYGLRIAEAALSFLMLATCGHVAQQLGPQMTQYFGGIGLGIFTGLMSLLMAALYIAAPLIRVDNAHTRRLHSALPGLLDVLMSSLWCILALAVGGASASGLTAYGLCSQPGAGAGRGGLLAGGGGAGGGADWLGPLLEQQARQAEQAAQAQRAAMAQLTANLPGGRRMLLQAGLLMRGTSGMCAAWGLAIASGFLLFLACGASAVLAGLAMRDGEGLVPVLKPNPGTAAGAPAEGTKTGGEGVTMASAAGAGADGKAAARQDPAD